MDFLKGIKSFFVGKDEGPNNIHLGRNDPCRCGSGKKYKKCHLREDEKKLRTRYSMNCGKT